MKLFVPIILVVFATIFCNSNFNESIKINKNEEIIKMYFKFFNEHNWIEMASLYDETVEVKDPAYGTEIIKLNHTAIIKKYIELHKMIPNVTDSILRIYHSENTAIVEFISKGTTPNGVNFRLPICTIFTFTNGKITKDLTYYDNFKFKI
jgi:ketosteroid isomerase-like protein